MNTLMTYFKQLKDLISRNSFLKSIGLLSGGVIVSHLIVFITSPILSRIFTPESFGRFAVFSTFLNTTVILAGLRYEYAVVIPERKEEAESLLVISLIFSGFSTLIFSILYYLFVRFDVLKYGELETWSTVAFFFIFLFSSITNCLRYWFIRVENFKIISVFNIYQNIWRSFAQVLLGFLGFGWVGLLLSEVVGRFFGIRELLSSVKNTTLIFHALPEKREINRVFLKYQKFAIFGLPSAFINTFSTVVPVLFISSLFGVAQAGQFALVQRMFGIPIVLISSSFSDVFYSKMTKLVKLNSLDAQNFFWSIAKILFLIASTISVALFFTIEYVVELIFGAKWKIAGEMAKVLVPWVFSQIAVSPLSTVIFIFSGQQAKLIFDVTLLALTVFSFVLASAQSLNALESLQIFSFLMLFCYGLYFFILLQLIKNNVNQGVKISKDN